MKHLDISLSPDLSNKTAYRLNITLMALVTGTVSSKGFKITPLFGVTLNPHQPALNFHLQGLNVQSQFSRE